MCGSRTSFSYGENYRSTILVQKNPVRLEENMAHSMHAEDDAIITAFSGSEGTPNGTSGRHGPRATWA